MSQNETLPATEYAWRPWKVGLVGLAGLLVVAGAVLATFGGGEPDGARSDAAAEETRETGGAGGAAAELDAKRSGADSGENRLFEPIPDSDGGSGSESPPGDGDDPDDGGDAGAGVPSSPSDVEWSPALLRGGFSFLVAFAVAYALRSFMLIAVFFLGVWGASMFLLANLGWIDVRWDAMQAAFEGWTSGLGDQFESFGRFVTGSLPSTGLAAAGLYTGLKRR